VIPWQPIGWQRWNDATRFDTSRMILKMAFKVQNTLELSRQWGRGRL